MSQLTIKQLKRLTKAELAIRLANHDIDVVVEEYSHQDLVEKVVGLEGIADEPADITNNEQQSNETQKRKIKFVVVNVLEMPDSPGDMHLIVDGYPRQIKKGVDVKLPVKAFNALDEAKKKTYTPTKNSEDKMVMAVKETHSYPFSIIDTIYEDEEG